MGNPVSYESHAFNPLSLSACISTTPRDVGEAADPVTFKSSPPHLTAYPSIQAFSVAINQLAGRPNQTGFSGRLYGVYLRCLFVVGTNNLTTVPFSHFHPLRDSRHPLRYHIHRRGRTAPTNQCWFGAIRLAAGPSTESAASGPGSRPRGTTGPGWSSETQWPRSAVKRL